MSNPIAFRSVGLKQPPGGDASGLDETIGAMRVHPRFQEAIRHMLDGASALYGGNRLLSRLIDDRGRFVGGMIVLYLHFCPASDEGESGFTVRRFQAFCTEQGLCSLGRARALLTLLCLSGHLTPSPGIIDRRELRLRPTQQLIELQRRRWQYQFEALALMLPPESTIPAAYSLPDFAPAFFRQLGRRFAAGFRLLRYAPELSQAIESKGGLLLILHLFVVAAERKQPGTAAVPISIAALSKRFGVARAHVRTLLANAASAGLVKRAGGETTVIVLPRLNAAVENFCAAVFGLLLHCASDAAAEVGHRDQSWSAEDATVSSMIWSAWPR